MQPWNSDIDTDSAEAIAVATLQRYFSRWSVWSPRGDQWVAVRPADDAVPSDRSRLIWAYGWSAGELAAHMAASEALLEAAR